MSKLTFNDLPAAIEGLILRIDILHDLVKSTRDRLDKLINEIQEQKEKNKPPGETASQKNVPEAEVLFDIGKAARFLGISNSKLYMAVERSQIAHFRNMNQIYFKKADLQVYKDRQNKTTMNRPAKTLQDEPTMVLGEDEDKLLSMKEAIEHTGFTRNNLYSYIKARKVHFIKKGRRIYFPIVALNQLMIMDINEKGLQTS